MCEKIFLYIKAHTEYDMQWDHNEGQGPFIKRRQEHRWADAHLRTMFSTYWHITNKPFTVRNCTGCRAFKSIPFVALEDPPKNPMHQSFIEEKGKVLTQVVYAERTPGNVTGTFITDLSGALNEVSGILAVSVQCVFRDDRHGTG